MHALLRMVLVCLACALPLAARALGDAHFESVGDADSIPDNNVTALAQDPSGLLWIGTPNGLIRYDGYRFRRYARDRDNPDSLGGVFIRALLVARDGRLWIGTDADGVSVYDPASGRFRPFRHQPGAAGSLAHDQVRALAEDGEGQIWLGTRMGLDRYDPERDTFVHYRLRAASGGSVNDERVFALLAGRAGDLWVGSWGGLMRMRAGSPDFEAVTGGADGTGPLAGQLIMSLYPLDHGRVAVGTAQAGSFLLDPASGLAHAMPTGLAHAPSATEALVLAMVQPTPDELWLGALGGIAVVDAHTGALRRRYLPDPSINSSLSNAQVRAFLIDQAGQIWIGGYSGGLQRHDPRNRAIRVLHHSPARESGLSSPSISSVLEASDGLLWAGTRDSGIDLIDRERGVVRSLRPDTEHPGALGNGMVISLAQTADGAVYAGTLAGMYRYDPGSQNFAAIGTAQGLTGTTVRVLLADPGGDLWVGSNTGLARWRPAVGRAQSIDLAGETGLAADVNALALEAGGRLWVGSAGGLYVLEAGAERLQVVAAAPGSAVDLSRASIVGLLIDRSGRLWLDSAEGLYRLLQWNGEYARFEAVSQRLGIGGRPFGANLLEDASGRIWTQRYVYDPQQDRVHELSRADGMDIGTAWFRAYTRTRDGRLLFGGSQGLAIVEPERFQPWGYEPPVVATAYWLDGVEQEPGTQATPLVVAAGHKRFGVEFAALDYSAPQRLRYRYRLSGFDADWIETDASRRVAGYSNLWPGRYELHVRASNRSGLWSTRELRVPIQVLPQLWQTAWFATLSTLLLLGCGWALWRRHVRRVREHELALEQLVDERTQELTRAKEGAESALAQLKGAQAQLVVAEKMATLGQLVAGVAHEINTPLGIALTAASVQGEELRHLQRKLAEQRVRPSDLSQYTSTVGEATRLVEENLARAAHLVRSFKQVSVDRSLDERRRFVLIDYLDDLIESLEIVWKRRPIRFTLECQKDIVLDSYPGTLGQIITTFAQNALHHAFAEGQPGRLTLSARALAEDQVELVFADDGKGISSEDLPHVFEPFFTTRRAEGMVGLGLHIVFNQVHARLGGRIEVSSAPGAGTRFTLVIPRSAP
ncbi:MAG: two-component regulator propeller domain-containing protein [Lysobacterales bacterium]